MRAEGRPLELTESADHEQLRAGVLSHPATAPGARRPAGPSLAMTDEPQRTGNRPPPPWEREADSESIPFGVWLRQQREMREITLREISDATKISLRYLEALEDERFDLLPAIVFAKGFLRQYAKYVGLDPDEAVNRFLVARRGEEPEGDGGEEERAVASLRRSGAAGAWKHVLLVVLVAAVLLALVFLVPRLMNGGPGGGPGTPPRGVAPPEVSLPPVPAPPPPAPAPNAEVPLTVTLDFRQDCWVEASVDGEPRVAEMRVQGESLQLQAQKKVELRLGNAGAVAIEVNGEPYAFDAAPGQVRHLEIEAPPKAAGPSPGPAAPRPSAPAPTAPRP